MALLAFGLAGQADLVGHARAHDRGEQPHGGADAGPLGGRGEPADELLCSGVAQGLGGGGVDHHHADDLARIAPVEFTQAQAGHGVADQDVGAADAGGVEQLLQVLGDRHAVAGIGRGVRIAHAGAVIGAVSQALGGELVLHGSEVGGEAEGAGLQHDGRLVGAERPHADDAHAPAADVDHLTAAREGTRRGDHDATESHIDKDGKDQAREKTHGPTLGGTSACGQAPTIVDACRPHLAFAGEVGRLACLV